MSAQIFVDCFDSLHSQAEHHTVHTARKTFIAEKKALLSFYDITMSYGSVN